MPNIAIVDDEPILLDLLSTLLLRDGHEVLALGSPVAALDSILSGQTQFDLLLTDVEMNSITGFDLVKQLMEAGFKSPVIFMSGYPRVPAELGSDLRKMAVLEKPFTAGELRAAVALALAGGMPGSRTAAGATSLQ